MKLSLFVLLYSVSLVQCNEFCKKYPKCSQGGGGENLPHHFRIGCTPTSPGWCHPCPAGTETYLVPAGRHAEHCTACPTGKYAGPDGNGCKECASGTVPNKDSSKCIQCGKHEYRNSHRYGCRSCAGEYGSYHCNNGINPEWDIIYNINVVSSAVCTQWGCSMFVIVVLFLTVVEKIILQ